ASARPSHGSGCTRRDLGTDQLDRGRDAYGTGYAGPGTAGGGHPPQHPERLALRLLSFPRLAAVRRPGTQVSQQQYVHLLWQGRPHRNDVPVFLSRPAASPGRNLPATVPVSAELVLLAGRRANV